MTPSSIDRAEARELAEAMIAAMERAIRYDYHHSPGCAVAALLLKDDMAGLSFTTDHAEDALCRLHELEVREVAENRIRAAARAFVSAGGRLDKAEG